MRVVTEAKNVQTGRSLTEMMGTLAIMGILAIAGIWMYNSAMDRLKANTLINEAQKRAVVVAGQIGFQGRTDPSLGEFFENEFAGGTFSTDVITDGLYQQFGIQVSNVPKAICQNILNSIGEGTAIRRLSPVGNPQTSLKSCQEENAFLLVYNNNASPTGGDVIYCDNSNCQTVCGQCVSEDGEQKCVNECPSTGNTCSSNTDCQGECVGCVIPSGQNQGTCQACQRVEYLEGTGTQYINTRTVPSIDTKITASFKIVSTVTDGVPMGVVAPNVLVSAIPAKKIGGAFRMSTSLDFSKQMTDEQFFNMMHSVSVENGKGILDGIEYTWSKIASYSTNRNIFLFAGNHGTAYGISKMKAYSFEIWNEGNLVRDFIPVHAPFQPADKQNCMYDKVSQTLFCNAATGNDFKTNLDE